MLKFFLSIILTTSIVTSNGSLPSNHRYDVIVARLEMVVLVMTQRVDFEREKITLSNYGSMLDSLCSLLSCDVRLHAHRSDAASKLPPVIIGILRHFMSVMFPATGADVSRKLLKFQNDMRMPESILLVGELVDSMIIPLLKLPALTELCFLSIRHYLLSSKCSAHQGTNIIPPDGKICGSLSAAGL